MIYSFLQTLVLFTLLSLSGASLSFLTVGDWGGVPVKPWTTPGQRATAAGMGIIGQQINSQFVLALGDNFYFSGVHSETSDRFANTWDNVYTAESLQTKWYVIAGNHDHKGNVSAQIAYTQESDRWTFPNFYYSQTFQDAAEGITVQVVFVDTVDLCGTTGLVDETDPKYFDKLPLRSKAEAENQWSWLEETLASSTADYLLVAGHYPVYSVCDHGNTDTLLTNLQPLLAQYQAHYLSGHDHCMEHIADDQGVHYFLSGMGDTCCYKATKLDEVPADFLKWHISLESRGKSTSGGFTAFTATASGLNAIFYDQDGNTLYSANNIAPRVKK